jgi:hypothetical protein
LNGELFKEKAWEGPEGWGEIGGTKVIEQHDWRGFWNILDGCWQLVNKTRPAQPVKGVICFGRSRSIMNTSAARVFFKNWLYLKIIQNHNFNSENEIALYQYP